MNKDRLESCKLKARGKFKKAVANLPLSSVFTFGGLAIVSVFGGLSVNATLNQKLNEFCSTSEFINARLEREQEIVEKFNNKEISDEECKEDIKKLSQIEFIKEVYVKYHPELSENLKNQEKAIDGFFIAGAASFVLASCSLVLLGTLDTTGLLISGEIDIANSKRKLLYEIEETELED